MDAFTLGYLAGHTDMSITKRYAHRSRAQSVRRWSAPLGTNLGTVVKM
jgi:hypothetical protein